MIWRQGAGEDGGGPPLPVAFFGYRLLLCGVNHFKTALFQPHRGTLTCKTGGYGAGVKKVSMRTAGEVLCYEFCYFEP